MAQGVVDVDAEDALAVLLLLVEIDHEVEPLVAVEAVVVAALDVLHHALVGITVVIVKPQGVVALQRQRGAVARAVNPGGSHVDALVELVHQHDVEVVPAVVLGGKHLAEVELLSGTVEETVGMRPGVAHPAGELAHLLLGKELDAIRPAVAHHHLVLPVGLVEREERRAVLVFHHVAHLLVIALHRKLEALPVVEGAHGHLVRVHRHDVARHRHPQVGGQADGVARQQVDILAHVGIARLQREVFGQQGPGAQAGLEAVVGLLVDGEGRVMQSGVQLEEVADFPVVFNIEVGLQGPDAGVVGHAVEGILGLRVLGLLQMDGRGGRAVGVVREVGAELHVVALQGLVVEVDFAAEVVDARMHPQVHVLCRVRLRSAPFGGIACAHAVAILGVGPRDVHEEVGLNHVVPSQGSHAVAPFPVEIEPLRIVGPAVSNALVFFGFHSGIHLVVARIDAEE